MKKSQSIFLLSGLVPLVAALIAIVASCSNDTTAVKSESQIEAERLNGVIQSSKIKILEDKKVLDDAKLKDLKDNPNKLLSEYLDKNELALKEDKFTYNIIDLADAQPKQGSATPTQPKTLSFKFRVVNKTNDKETYDSILASVAYQYQPGTAVENPALTQAVTTIETAHTNKSFKLKDDKTTMSQADVDKLTANPGLLLTTEFSDGFPSLDQGLTPSITKNNFSIINRKQAQGTTNKTIQFKVTVSDAQKVEKETKQLTFDFTLQAAAQPTPAKQQTVAKTSVTAGSLGLTGKVAAEQSKLNSNFIFQNITKLVDGDHAVTKAADVTDVVVTPDQNDSKQLTLAFKLAANTYYVAGGTLGQAKSENFSIQITGFAKAVKAAAKKAEFRASELGQGFESKTYAELNTAINSRNWLFTNKEKYLSGDLTGGTTAQNFVHNSGATSITFPEVVGQQKATMTFSVAAGRTYDDQGIVSTAPTQITFTVLIGQ